MGLELNKFNWIFFNKVEENEEITNNFYIEGEECDIGYKTVRDIAIFTKKRIIIRDKQGLTGKK